MRRRAEKKTVPIPVQSMRELAAEWADQWRARNQLAGDRRDEHQIPQEE